MHAYGILAIFAASLLFGATPVQGQGGPFARMFSGEKSTQTTKRGFAQKSQAEKRSPFAGSKRVEIDLTHQKLRAYEGNRLVMQSRISSGRNGWTPTGRFTAGPYKAVNHYSSLYQNAHMPWSVQVNGHIFIHGFATVPDYPASHGCIRLPINGSNPAKRFYEWVEVGTPIRIAY